MRKFSHFQIENCIVVLNDECIIIFFFLATGIARSVTPGQALRGVAYTPNLTSVGGESTAPSDTQVTYPHFPAHSTLI